MIGQHMLTIRRRKIVLKKNCEIFRMDYWSWATKKRVCYLLTKF